jgi:hypothetical protein
MVPLTASPNAAANRPDSRNNSTRAIALTATNAFMNGT